MARLLTPEQREQVIRGRDLMRRALERSSGTLQEFLDSRARLEQLIADCEAELADDAAARPRPVELRIVARRCVSKRRSSYAMPQPQHKRRAAAMEVPHNNR